LEFRFVQGDDEWLAIEFLYNKDLRREYEAASYTCIFKNSALYRVCGPVSPSSATTRPTVIPRQFAECWLREKGLDIAIASPALAQDEIRGAVDRKQYGKGCGDWGTFILLTGAWLGIAVERIADDVRESHFDPFKLRIGMTPIEVERAFGIATFRCPVCDDVEARLYGYGLKARADNGWDDETWVAVAFERDHVVGVFHDQFVFAFLPPDHPARKERNSSKDSATSAPASSSRTPT
jgi:hypothetical protein